jgi:hypothetical protein
LALAFGRNLPMNTIDFPKFFLFLGEIATDIYRIVIRKKWMMPSMLAEVMTTIVDMNAH